MAAADSVGARPPGDLLDVNVWLSLLDENHDHHKVARRYWEKQSAPAMAFCRVTMLGLLRLMTHPKVMAGQPFTAGEAWQAYRRLRALPEIVFLGEAGAEADVEQRLTRFSDQPGFAQALWTDAYLAALASSCGFRLVSFDSDFARFEGLDFLHLEA
jgi:hypothetical protein